MMQTRRDVRMRITPPHAAALVLFACGCGGPPSTVEGVVTLDGRPLAAACVTFHPDAPGPVAYGRSFDDGSYHLKTGAAGTGLAAGRYRVTVFAMEVVAGAGERAGPLLTPATYADPSTTPLRCEVGDGANVIPLALESVATPGGR